MSEPPTMLIQEPDDDRTLIDPRFSSRPADQPFEGSGAAAPFADRSPSVAQVGARTHTPWPRLRAILRRQQRRIVETGVVLALLFGLGLVAHQQRRAADALRHAIEEMKISRPTSPAHELPGSAGRARSPVGAEPGVEPSIREVAPGEREQLEHRGASLVGSNNFAGALTHYQRLAALFPNQAPFGDVATVLKAKLRCADPERSLCP